MSGSASEGTDEGTDARRRRWPLFAAVGLGIALVSGAGGAAVGRATAPGPTIVVAPGPVVQQSPAASALPVQRPELVVADTTAAVPAVFTASSDLPDDPGVATGYSVTAGQVSGPALASALGDAFGVSGEVAQTGDGWLLGVNDGSSPTVAVNDDALLSWTYADPAAERAAGGAAIDPDTAREQVSSLLAEIGVDVASVDWQVDRFDDRTTVTAWQLLGGSRTDLRWEVSVGSKGEVLSAHGFAAGLVEVPGYPVVGAATAVRRSAAPTWAALGPLPVASATGEPAEPTPSPSIPTSTGAPARPALSVPIARVDVVSAELGLAQYRQPDGAVLILPSYRVTGADGSRWSVIALTTADVEFVSVPYPSASPTGP